MNNFKFLICDDSALCRRQMTNLLNQLGYTECFEAADGEQSVSLYKEHKPDIVFLDIVMPNKDGIEVLKDIFALNPDAKVIMASSVGTQSHLKAALELGACDFVQKPASLEEIDNVIQRVIRG